MTLSFDIEISVPDQMPRASPKRNGYCRQYFAADKLNTNHSLQLGRSLAGRVPLLYFYK